MLPPLLRRMRGACTADLQAHVSLSFAASFAGVSPVIAGYRGQAGVHLLDEGVLLGICCFGET